MCGIAGYLAFGAPPPGEVEALERTNEAMTSRGPDGLGLWISPEGRIGLAHRRLAIIDLSAAGAQPMLDRAGELVITFNGEIYNYRELRAELVADGVAFNSTSDTEVILELYRRHGAGLTSRLRGMFAFAIWDQRHGTLFLARDHFGQKPLYWSTEGGVFRFASQVKALLAGSRLSRDPSAEGTVGFLLWGSVPEPFTLYRSIRSLEAGTSMTVHSDGRHEVRRYADQAAVAPASCGRSLDEALRDSIAHHLVADVPVGIFLSSGLDSATIAAHAASLADQPLRSITVGFEEFRGTSHDETSLAARLAERFGFDHQTVWIAHADFDECFDHIIAAMDQPTIDGINSYFVSRAAASTGLKVALSGIGGDELFGGYPSFRQVPAMAFTLGWLRRFPLLLRMASQTARWLSDLMASPKYAGLFEHGTTLAGAYLLRRALFLPPEIVRLVEPAVAREGLEGLATMERLAGLTAGTVTDFEAVGRLEVGQYMRNQLLRDADWAGMAHSLEIRLPLVDIELDRLIVARQRSQAPYGKQDLAATVVPPLPNAIRQRRKTGFRTPTWRRDPATGEALPNITDWRSWALQLWAEARR